MRVFGKKSRGILSAIVVLLCAARTGGADRPAAEPPQYEVKMIAPFISVADDIALGLNDQGQAAFWQRGKDDILRAAVWENGTSTEAGMPKGRKSSLGRAVNARGQMAGWASDGGNLVDSRATIHAVLLDKNKALDLGTLGGRNSQAFGLNDAGQVVGVAMQKDGLRHAFVWKRGKMQDLGGLLKDGYSAAYGINRAGHCVGVSAFDARDNHAVLWRNGKITDLGTLPGGTGSFARAINSRDQIVGFGRVGDDTHAFLYENEKMTDLGTLGKDPSNANSINDAGAIVGASGIKGGRRHACIWLNKTPFDLNDCIPKADGWTLREAYKINSGGQIICLGANKTGILYALLLTPIGLQAK